MTLTGPLSPEAAHALWTLPAGAAHLVLLMARAATGLPGAHIAVPEGAVLHRLHGTLLPVEQRAAIAPDPDGRRKLVLATAIAETSLTIPGVTAVVDGGRARRSRCCRWAS